MGSEVQQQVVSVETMVAIIGEQTVEIRVLRETVGNLRRALAEKEKNNDE